MPTMKFSSSGWLRNPCCHVVTTCPQASEVGCLRAGQWGRCQGEWGLPPALTFLGPSTIGITSFRGGAPGEQGIPRTQRDNGRAAGSQRESSSRRANSLEAPRGLRECLDNRLLLTTVPVYTLSSLKGFKTPLERATRARLQGRARRLSPPMGKGLWERHKHGESAPEPALGQEVHLPGPRSSGG